MSSNKQVLEHPLTNVSDVSDDSDYVQREPECCYTCYGFLTFIWCWYALVIPIVGAVLAYVDWERRPRRARWIIGFSCTGVIWEIIFVIVYYYA